MSTGATHADSPDADAEAGLPVVWFDRPAGRLQRELLEGRAQIVDVRGDDPLEGIERAEGAIVGAAIRYDSAVYERAPLLRVIARAGIGFDNLDLDDATEFGIAACNTPDGPTVSTAEHAVALIFAVTKGLKESARRLEAAEGDYWARHGHLELAGSTLALLGLGRIGGYVARVMSAVGMNIVAYDPYAADERFAELGARRAATPSEAVASAHVVSVHAPLSEATHHLVNADLLAAMRNGVYLVNTSRGGLVDQDALLAALGADKVRGAGLDVTEPEPLPPGHPLLGRPDVVVTPHVASATVAGRRRIFTHAVAEVMTALDGAQPPNMLNPQAWPGRNA
ncbi:NAD(P)-dependent oxidoreductase [Candidatus Poriferisodalis sp.]|uniref:NAD(P)-dependent oxidoreductase n=1 Tax=Candidatus Poriferisodalis sp. TaxID=3101277 RepID=UPI003B0110C5